MAQRASRANIALSRPATRPLIRFPGEFSMRSFRVLLAALATATLCAFTAPTHASLGTNFTDQWWNPDEPGWGASVLQQYDTLFVDLFVYGPDGKPVWYTAAVYLDPQSGRTLFTGDR